MDQIAHSASSTSEQALSQKLHWARIMTFMSRGSSCSMTQDQLRSTVVFTCFVDIHEKVLL